MNINALAAAGLLSAALCIGCDNSSNTPATPAPAASSAGATNDKAKDMAAGIKAQAADAQAGAAAAMADAKASATDSGNALVAKAQALYAQATTAMGNAKFDDAQKYVDELKSLRDKLPAEWQAKVDQLAQMVSDAKAKMSNRPSMPK